ncbi:Lrp/AsnC family transcriptional regulator [Micromonosporaceae bacterium Da 78-11]
MATKSRTLDRTDRQILHALQIAPRAPFARIAAVLDVSEQTVARRYQRMRTDGVIRVLARADPARLAGTTNWTLRIGCRPGTATTLAAALARRSDTAWVSIGAGGAEITSQAEVLDGQDGLLHHLPRASAVLTFTAHQILHRFAGRGDVDWIAPGHELDAAQRATLVEGLGVVVSTNPTHQPTGEARLEPRDAPLIQALTRDGRSGWAALAAATGWTQRQVAQRVADLVASGAVYFEMDVAHAVIGFRSVANLWFTVAPADLADVGARLADHSELAFVAAMTGTANIMASAVCRDAEALYRYITTKVAAIEGVRTLETVPQLARVKQSYFLVEDGVLREPPA